MPSWRAASTHLAREATKPSKCTVSPRPRMLKVCLMCVGRACASRSASRRSRPRASCSRVRRCTLARSATSHSPSPAYNAGSPELPARRAVHLLPACGKGARANHRQKQVTQPCADRRKRRSSERPASGQRRHWRTARQAPGLQEGERGFLEPLQAPQRAAAPPVCLGPGGAGRSCRVRRGERLSVPQRLAQRERAVAQQLVPRVALRQCRERVGIPAQLCAGQVCCERLPQDTCSTVC